MIRRDRDLIALGRAVRQLRVERNISAGGLVRASGLSAWCLHAIEAGRFDPPLDALFALARGLGISADELARRAEAQGTGCAPDE